MKNIFISAVLLLLLGGEGVQPARAQFQLAHSVFGNGATGSTNDRHRIDATVGQPLVGVNATIRSGFWQVSHVLVTTAVEPHDLPEGIPDRYRLEQNYPNPFNPSTVIQYGLPEGTTVRLTVYNMLGQVVRVLIDQAQPAGSYSVRWNGLDEGGRPVSSGIYLYRVKTEGFTTTRKMLLVK